MSSLIQSQRQCLTQRWNRTGLQPVITSRTRSVHHKRLVELDVVNLRLSIGRIHRQHRSVFKRQLAASGTRWD